MMVHVRVDFGRTTDGLGALGTHAVPALFGLTWPRSTDLFHDLNHQVMILRSIGGGWLETKTFLFDKMGVRFTSTLLEKSRLVASPANNFQQAQPR
jgi:hypothetical protein